MERTNTLQPQLRFYQYDGHGSVRALTDIDGAETDRYEYDAYGILIERHARDGLGAMVPVSFEATYALDDLRTENPYMYCGEYFEVASGLCHFRARMFDPMVGRLQNVDPFEGINFAPLTLHKYQYSHSNPVSFIDPTGHMTLLQTSASTAILAAIALVAIYYTCESVISGICDATALLIGSWAESQIFSTGSEEIASNIGGQGSAFGHNELFMAGIISAATVFRKHWDDFRRDDRLRRKSHKRHNIQFEMPSSPCSSGVRKRIESFPVGNIDYTIWFGGKPGRLLQFAYNAGPTNNAVLFKYRVDYIDYRDPSGPKFHLHQHLEVFGVKNYDHEPLLK